MINMNLEIVKGDSKTYCLLFKKKNVPVDVTGWKVLFTVKKNINDSDNDAAIKVDVTAAVPDSLMGKILIPLTKTNTDIPVGKYYYDFKLKKTSLDRETIATGEFRINYTITIRDS